MATTNDPLDITGGLGGISFYTAIGCNKKIARQKGGPGRNNVRKSPKFKKLRLAQNELRGRAMCAEDIRHALGIWTLPIVDRHLQVRVAGLLQQVQNMDDLIKFGKRNVQLSQFKEVLNQIPYYYYKPLNEIMLCSYTVETREDKKAVTVTLKGLNPVRHIKAPSMASHFKLCVGIGTVTDYATDKDSTFYVKVSQGMRDMGNETESEWIAIDAPLMDEVSITAVMPDSYELKAYHSVLRSFGIVFGKMTYKVTEIAKDRGSIVFLGAV